MNFKGFIVEGKFVDGFCYCSIYIKYVGVGGLVLGNEVDLDCVIEVGMILG